MKKRDKSLNDYKYYYTLSNATKLLKKENQIFLEKYGFSVRKELYSEEPIMFSYILSFQGKNIPLERPIHNIVKIWYHATNLYRDWEKPDEKLYEQDMYRYFTISSAIRLPKKEEQLYYEKSGYSVKKHRKEKDKDEFYYKVYYNENEFTTLIFENVISAWKNVKQHIELIEKKNK